ncbi:MAG: hypothetical protein ABR499_17905 [Gemmatimonadaceae bacterium]
MRRPPSSPKPARPKSRRLIARVSVRLRREGGSLSLTIPRYIVRCWNLEPGARLVVRSTDEGVLLYPRYFLPYRPGRTPGGANRRRGGSSAPAGPTT